VRLTGVERIAAQRALTNLSHSGLLSGQGQDTFAGGVAGASRYLPAFSADSVGGGRALVVSTHATNGLSLTADPLRAAGPTVAALKATDPSAAHVGSHVITLGDHTTIHLNGISVHHLPKQ
jgi:hypothetical protein